METWLRKRMNEKQLAQFERDCSLTFATAAAVESEWGATPEAAAAQAALGASTPTMGFID